MKNPKMLNNILLICSIISLLISFALCCLVGESEIFGVVGIVRYSWIMWLFIPVNACFLLILKKTKVAKKVNYIVTIIVIVLLSIYGSYRFIFADTVSYNTENLQSIEKYVDITFPNNIKIATWQLEEYKISNIKIIDCAENDNFQRIIENDNRWNKKIDTFAKSYFYPIVQADLDSFDYFMFYNISLNEFNNYSLSEGNYDCLFVAYNYEVGSLVVLEDYTLKIV